MVKPEIGIYNLTFTSADPSLSSASVLLTITPGASKHLGLLPYCSTSEQGCQTASNCTCQWYRASAEVSVHPFIANVLDGGFNPVGVFETRSCETCERESGTALVENHHSVPSEGKRWMRVRRRRQCDVETRGCIMFACRYPRPNHPFRRKLLRWSHSPRPHLLGLTRSWCRAQVCSEWSTFCRLCQANRKILYSRKLKRVKYLYPHCTQGSRTRHIRSLAECMMAAAIFLSTSTYGAQITVRCETAELEDYPQGIDPLIGGSNYAISCANITACSAQVRLRFARMINLFYFEKLIN